MADNTTLNTGTGGDIIRAEERAGGIKTQIIGIDLNPGSASESLMAGAMPILQSLTPGSGSFTALNNAVTFTLNGEPNVTFQLTGTWVGQVIFEASNDNSAWSSIYSLQAGDGVVKNTVSQNDIYRCSTSGFKYVRARCSSYTSGTIVVTGFASTGTSGVFLNFPPVVGEMYRLHVPKQAAGANKVYFDLFNATGSGRVIFIKRVIPIVSGAVAVTGTLSVDLHLTRTTAVGTGGTAATNESTSITSITFTKMDSNNVDLPSQITARLTPTAGATAGAVLSWCSVFTEETNASSYLGHTNDLALRFDDQDQKVVIRENTGVRVVQGTVASVGNIGFDVIFEIK